MSDSPYQRALDYIYSFVDLEKEAQARQAFYYDLRRVDEILARLGNPHLKLKTVHIAGTKGKGSVAAMTASALIASGYTTALYTSPHLISFNERIRVNNKMISNEEVVSLLERIKPDIEAVNKKATYGKLTTFEIMTALGFLYFKEKGCDFQVVEVGLGGRLDATNVVNPDVCVITSISYDHMDVLGNTLTEIATQKAGIIKPGTVVVSSPQSEEPAQVFRETCARLGAKLIEVGKDVTWQCLGFDARQQMLKVRGNLGTYILTIPLLGEHQLDNAATAVAALEVLKDKGFHITKESIIRGLAQVDWPGRLQTLNRKPLLVIDGAHNADSARKLRKALEAYYKFNRAILIIGTSSDKDIAGIVGELSPIFCRVIITRSIHPRAIETTSLVAEFRKHGLEPEETSDVQTALRKAINVAGERDLICVTGSLFVVAEVLEHAQELRLTA